MGLITIENKRDSFSSSSNKRQNFIESKRESFCKLNSADKAMLRNTEKLFESKNPNDIARAARTMAAIENQKAYIEEQVGRQGAMSLMEGTTVSDLGTLSRSYLGVVDLFYPEQIGQYLTDDQMINAPAGIITAAEPVYSDTAGGVNAGDSAYKSIENGEYASNTYTASLNDSTAIAAGSTVTLTAGQFQALFPRVGAANARVMPSTVRVNCPGKVMALDTGIEGSTHSSLMGEGVDITANSDFNYKTGALTFKLPSNVEILATENLSLEISVHGDRPEAGEGVITPKVTGVQIRFKTTTVEVEQHFCKVDYSVVSALYARSIKNTDLDDMASRAVAIVLKNERDTNIINSITHNAVFDPALTFSAAGKTGYALQDVYAESMLKIDYAETAINLEMGRGGVDFVLVGSQGKNIFKCVKDFKPAAATGDPRVGSFLLETIGDRINVVYSRNVKADEFYVGYRGFEFGDSAVISATYVPLYITKLLENGDTMQALRGFVSLYTNRINIPGYLRKGIITNFNS
jgi:hypothetical protein